jgi:hypothetical protein
LIITKITKVYIDTLTFIVYALFSTQKRKEKKMTIKPKEKELTFYYGNGESSDRAYGVVRKFLFQLEERGIKISLRRIDSDDGLYSDHIFGTCLPALHLEYDSSGIFDPTVVSGADRIEYFLRRLIEHPSSGDPSRDVCDVLSACFKEKWGEPEKKIKNRIFFSYGNGKESKLARSYVQDHSARLMDLGIEVVELHFPVNEDDNDYIATSRFPSIHFDDDLSYILFGREVVLGNDKIRYFLEKLMENPGGNLIMIFNTCENEGWKKGRLDQGQ